MNLIMLVLVVVVAVAIWRPAIVRDWTQDLDFERIFSVIFDFLTARLGDIFNIFREALERIAVALQKVVIARIQDMLSDKAKDLEQSVEFPKYVPQK